MTCTSTTPSTPVYRPSTEIIYPAMARFGPERTLMPRYLAARLERLRTTRAHRLTTEATALFTTARDLYETAAAREPKAAGRQRRAAHLIAARAERVTARSLLWRPSRPVLVEDRDDAPTTTEETHEDRRH